MKLTINTETKEVEILSSVSIADFLKFIEEQPFLKEYTVKFLMEKPKPVETVKDSKETNKEKEDFIRDLIERNKQKEQPFIPCPWDTHPSPFTNPNPFKNPYKPIWVIDFETLPKYPFGGFEITCLHK